jgi:hypothetical protein
VVHHLLDDWHTLDAIALSPAETQLKTDLEEVVRSGLVNFLAVGAALSRIRSLRLFRREYATFCGYVTAQAGLTPQQYSELCRVQLMAETLLDPKPPNRRVSFARPPEVSGATPHMPAARAGRASTVNTPVS